MIGAIQQDERARQRGRSAAATPAFSVPELPPSFDLGLSSSAPTVLACPAAPAAVSPPATDYAAFLGRSVGTGQCVGLVQAATPGLGPTATWRAGAPVQGNTSLQPGTPIATFDGGGRYANHTDGSSHAAIYLGQNAKGVLVLDQWAGSAAAVRSIPWTTQGGAPANTGSAFRVIGNA